MAKHLPKGLDDRAFEENMNRCLHTRAGSNACHKFV